MAPRLPHSDAAISRPVSCFQPPLPRRRRRARVAAAASAPTRSRGISQADGRARERRRRRRKEAGEISGAMALDSDASSQGGDHRSFRQITRHRLLFEMLRSTRKDSKSTRKVLIMDKFTVKIMSRACNMPDITEEGVLLVEDFYKRRQPLPSLDAIYFIQPTKENIVIFLSDMSGRSPLYKKAYVFFSSPIQKELVAQIKRFECSTSHRGT